MPSATNSYLDLYEYLPNLQEANNLAKRVDGTRIVFRVFDSKSFRKYDPTTGFVATIHENTTLSREELAEAHLDWENRSIPTPWLSTSRRWLWAVWEMNRRHELWSCKAGTRTGIRVAVIDLTACRDASAAHSPIHALSILGQTSDFRSFSDISDEILIHGRIPASAITSVWNFETLFGVPGVHSVLSHRMSSSTGGYKDYREIHCEIVKCLESPQIQPWNAKDEGERSAKTAIGMLQAGYDQLGKQLDRMIDPVRETREWCAAIKSGQGPSMNNLARNPSMLKPSTERAGGKPANSSTKGSNMSSIPTIGDALTLLNKGATMFQEIVTQSGLSATRIIQHADLTGHSDPPIVDAYNLLVAYHKSVDNGLTIFASTHGSPLNHTLKLFLRLESASFHPQRKCYEALLIRLARHKIEYLRSIALELARTVPLGILDRLEIDQQDWFTIRWNIMGSIHSWLAPLERKLEGLEEKEVASQVLRAKFGWLEKEGKYPKWWESLGTHLTVDEPDSMYGPSERSYAYSV